ncbi:MAG: DUF2497 domain-containing protein [Sphingomonadaceae bacterium]|uniref:DUF2497 domain-containing protein n=1 Tax=Thermaurantiacus sp. TaxID=2820283 RepID=UPI00298F1E87|nr:DUF2497 domain-containing protein [Thermaurantiacus sp.]MCS6986611.1 DUF2497 domain-containing protein [Sphingomonadaceae bacterium]MDW8414128.1 DUF2497 domain-containing protein [Thermaurantiacus sp.]
MSAKGRDPLDPRLKSILESIRQTVAGEAPAGAPEQAPAAEAAPAPRPLRPNVPPGERTVEEFLADLIRPQVEAWLEAHLPEIVQRLAAEEIRRLTGGT